MQRHSREFWEEQLREYWGSGFTVSEYSELIGQPHMTVMRWIRKLRSEHESSEIIEPEQECPVRMIEVVPNQRIFPKSGKIATFGEYTAVFLTILCAFSAPHSF